jgi:hypothetical protein
MFIQFDQLQKLGRDNFDLGLRLFGGTNNVAQAITQEIAEYSRRTLQQNVSVGEKLAGSKTLDGTIDLQSDHAKAAIDDFVAQSKRMGELYQSLAIQAAKSLESAFAKQTPAEGTAAKRTPEQGDNAAGRGAVPTDIKAEPSIVAGEPGKTAERNAVKEAVATVVKQAAEAARQTSPGNN